MRIEENYKILVGFPKNAIPPLLGVLWSRTPRWKIELQFSGYQSLWRALKTKFPKSALSTCMFFALNIGRLRLHIPTWWGSHPGITMLYKEE